jgi:hypothetical protein
LRQILQDSLPMSGSAVFGVHVIDDESPHIVKRPQNAGASWSTRVNPDSILSGKSPPGTGGAIPGKYVD